ncbi:hypothetical protein R4Z09_16990 [Niallia oryzisoli]|uniref:Uncharacterized protein n=1 Tax=Niallia oryzisoli TaxID=1737571 RepID=A0ABZ2C7E3_9BACI
MRFMFKRAAREELQTDLNIVQQTLNSGYFMLIDLLFWSLLLTIFTTPAHHSFLMAVIIFFGYYISGISIFLLLRSLLKE